MRRLNSESTLLWKYVFPALWFGFLGLFLLIGLVQMFYKAEVHIQFMVMPVLMAGFVYLLLKLLVFDLVDEVWDAGDALVVKNKDREERIPLANIINVRDATGTRPQRITLTLRYPCVFGQKIAFAPPTRFLPFSPHPVATELIERIDAARDNVR